jgi:ABC-type uncharacterized transport system permease subunit
MPDISFTERSRRHSFIRRKIKITRTTATMLIEGSMILVSLLINMCQFDNPMFDSISKPSVYRIKISNDIPETYSKPYPNIENPIT